MVRSHVNLNKHNMHDKLMDIFIDSIRAVCLMEWVRQIEHNGSRNK